MRAEATYLATGAGYVVRPYDVVADARRWRWRRPAACGRTVFLDLPPHLRAQLERAAQDFTATMRAARLADHGRVPPMGDDLPAPAAAPLPDEVRPPTVDPRDTVPADDEGAPAGGDTGTTDGDA